MRKQYIKPLCETTETLTRSSFLSGSWAVDGEKKDVVEGNPKGELDTRKHTYGQGLWED